MGYWFGSLVFLLFEVVGFFTVKGIYGKQGHNSSRFRDHNKTMYVSVCFLLSGRRFSLWIRSFVTSVLSLQVASGPRRYCGILLLDDVDHCVHRTNVSIG